VSDFAIAGIAAKLQYNDNIPLTVDNWLLDKHTAY
jgi:hypothetical protein